MKIMKHSQESTNANGLLLGIDLDGVLNVTNSFAMPNITDDDEKSNKSAGTSRPLLWTPGFDFRSNVVCSQREVPDCYAQAAQRGAGRRQRCWILPVLLAGGVFEAVVDRAAGAASGEAPSWWNCNCSW